MISQRIKELRLENKLTQKELSDFLGLTPKMISFYELGQRVPPSDIILKLADKFKVSTDYLLGNETPAAEKPSAPSKRDLNDLAKFLNKTEVMFDGDTYNLSEEDQQKLRNALEFVFWDAKRQNKRKKD
jgi:immunity repressor protein